MKNESSNDRRDSNKSILDRVVDYVCTPCYQPTEEEAITFQALGFSRPTIEAFWVVFCRINKSLSGEISQEEFYSYFHFDTGSSQFIGRCFDYFDLTSENRIGFLEFMVSVWNICTLKIDTLTNFAFDMYDLDFDGELSLPEIERMLQELYGLHLTSSDNHILSDINRFAEQRGGTLNLTSFTIYTTNHSMLLFPIFVLQRKIQKKVMGIMYWKDIENMRSTSENRRKSNAARSKMIFDHRHIQTLMRTHKKSNITSLLNHTEESTNGSVSMPRRNMLNAKVKNEKFKNAVEKLKLIKGEQYQMIEKIRMKSKNSVENAVESVVDKAVDIRSKTKKTLIRFAALVNRKGHPDKPDIVTAKKIMKHQKVVESHPFHKENDSSSENNEIKKIRFQRHKMRKAKAPTLVRKSNDKSTFGFYSSFSTHARPRAPGILVHNEVK
jgi:Ca2+-binding EF-hand superfamily protein